MKILLKHLIIFERKFIQFDQIRRPVFHVYISNLIQHILFVMLHQNFFVKMNSCDRFRYSYFGKYSNLFAKLKSKIKIFE